MPTNAQSPSPSDNAGGRPAKRKRVALACETCRDRKIRCDGGKPRCRPCTKRGESTDDCVYAVIASSAKQASEQEYIASLQRQVRDLSQVLGSLRSSTASRDGGSPSQRAASRHDHQASSSAGRYPADDFNNGGENSNACSEELGRDGPSPVNAMGASISVRSPAASTHHDEFYGQSSVQSLLQEVSKSTRQRYKPNATQPGSQQHQAPGHGEKWINASHADAARSLLQPQYALPPRPHAEQLISLYFDHVHIFYPWTHAPSFRSQFNALFTLEGYQGHSIQKLGDIGLGGDRCPLSVFSCAVNAMFALGCEFSDFPDKEQASATFYGRMRDLLQAELVDHSSIAHVQVLLLASLYLSTTQYPTRCYNMVGLACRMAVALGLHVEKPSTKHSDMETQIRRRLWHGCFQLEIMTLGRPSMMVNDNVPLPAAIDDEYLLDDGRVSEQPSNIISQNCFTVENIKAIKILGMILRRIYHPPPQEQPSLPNFSDLSTLLELDNMLQKAKEDTPVFLRLYGSPEGSLSSRRLVLRRQANVLHARFLHLCIFLFRPSSTAFCAAARPPPSRPEPADHSAVLGEGEAALPIQNDLPILFRGECATLCVKTACELIESVSRAIAEFATGAWWFGLFYLVTGGVIIILAESTQLQKQSFDGEMLARSWQLCYNTIQRLSLQHARAHEYLQSLRALRDRALLKYGSAADDPAPAIMEETGAFPRADVDVSETYDAYGDLQQTAHIAWGTGFLEHDWGVPYYLEN